MINHSTLQLTSVVPSDLYLKITSDGIQDIPMSFSKVPIDFFVSVASECSTLAHYTSGYLTSLKLNTQCIVLNDSYTYQTDNFTVSTECLPFSGLFLKGTLTVYASAMSAINAHIDDSECACDTDEIKSWNRPTSPNTTIYVEGVFNVNGSVQTLTGTSNSFRLLPYNDFYMIKRRNENITLTDRMKRLAIDPKLSNSKEYWTFVEGLYGSDITDFNHSINSDIANFSNNNIFIDTLNYRMIKKVKNLFGEEFTSFEISDIPKSVERHLNIGTIDTNRLFGQKCACNMNFKMDGNCGTEQCRTCLKTKKINNLGGVLNGTDMISAGVPILYKSNTSDAFNVIFPTDQNGLSTYSLNSLTAQSIDSRNDVCFYEWNQEPQNNVIGNFLLFGDDLENKTRLMSQDIQSWELILEENLLLDMHEILS